MLFLLSIVYVATRGWGFCIVYIEENTYRIWEDEMRTNISSYARPIENRTNLDAVQQINKISY